MNQVDQLYVDAMQGLARIAELERENAAKHYRIVELEAQLEALEYSIGAGGVESLRKQEAATDRDTHFYLAGWNGARRDADPNAHFQSAMKAAPPAQAQEDARDPIRDLIAMHAAELDRNECAYFELAYHRSTGWMAWITDKPLCMPAVINPDRKVLAQGQGDTPDEACADAARAAQGAGHE